MADTQTQPKELRKNNALAQLDVEQLKTLLELLSSQVHAAAQPEAARALEHLARTQDEIRRVLEHLAGTLAPAGRLGLSVEQTATYLQVAQPTIRKWLDEGLLEEIEGPKPLEVSPRSVFEVGQVLGRVKESYPSREWTKSLAAFLHDRDIQGQPSFLRGVEEAREDGLVEL